MLICKISLNCKIMRNYVIINLLKIDHNLYFINDVKL